MKKLSTRKKDVGNPPHEYLVFAREVAMDYYRIRSSKMLKVSFPNHSESRIMRLQEDLKRKFDQKLNASKQYNGIFTYHILYT